MAAQSNTVPNMQPDQAQAFTDAVKASMNVSGEHGTRAADVARDGMSRMANLNEKAAENAKHIMQKNVDTASQQAREAADRFTRSLGFTGQDSERLARQSQQNIEAITRCGTVLAQAYQDASRNWFELGQKQWQRNLDGLNKLMRATSVQEFTAIQSELVREGLQHMVQDSKAIAQSSVRAVEEASKVFTSIGPQGHTPVR